MNALSQDREEILRLRTELEKERATVKRLRADLRRKRIRKLKR